MILPSETRLTPIDDLIPHPENPRRGTIPAIVDSIRTNGFYGTVVAQTSTRHVIAGNHRMLAAREVGLTDIPVTWIDVTDDQARRILLADNRTSDLATHDEQALVDLLNTLTETTDGLAGTGYTPEDLDDLLRSFDTPLLDETAHGPMTGDEGHVTLRLDVDPASSRRWHDHRKGYQDDTDALDAILP